MCQMAPAFGALVDIWGARQIEGRGRMAAVGDEAREMHVVVAWDEFVAMVRGAVSDRYARFYSALAVAMVVLVSAPVFQDVDVQEVGDAEPVRHGPYTVFDLADLPGGSG